MLLVSGCAASVPPNIESDRGDAARLTVLDVSRVIDDRWQHLLIKGKTRYRIVAMDGRLAIGATGSGGASGLIRRTDIDADACPFMDWVWRVDRLQLTADLTNKAGDDVAAAIFLLFGDPGFMSTPDPVPTLRYVWTNDRAKAGDIVDNPYMPGIVRNLVIEAGATRLGEWVKERRNVYQDFARAFGYAPPDAIAAIALFTDNDQTGEPVTAYFREIAFDCR